RHAGRWVQGARPGNEPGDVAAFEHTGSAAPGDSGDPILAVKDLSRVFGGVEALSNISLRFEEGMIHGLIGPNGAGKTTFINLVTGLSSPSSGQIIWQGREIQGRPPHVIARAGLARTYQSIHLF